MTNNQINTAIAQACGWTILKKPLSGFGFAAYAKEPNGNPSPGIPDYCGDLNAMHEAEQMLTTFDEWDIYCVHLGDTQPSCAKATSRQRAEAFLRTLGKWEEETK